MLTRVSRVTTARRLGALAAMSGAALFLLSGCGGSGSTLTGASHDGVTLTVGSQTLNLTDVRQAYDVTHHTTSIDADDGSNGTGGMGGMMGRHQMSLSFPGDSTGTWTQGQGCQFGMDSGSGMMDSSDMTVTCTNYPDVGGEMTGTFSGHMGGQPVSGQFIVRRAQ